MLSSHRVVFQDNTVLRDLSVNLGAYLSGTETIAVVASEDALYVGSDLPFNHRWFEVSSVNAAASVVSVSLWNGSDWDAAVDVIDQTATSGVTLAKSGIISWVPDRYKSWTVEDSTEDIPELSSLKIYGMYWAKFSFSQNLTLTTALKYIGHKFSTDEDLESEYPELAGSTPKSAFATGKTNWNDQAFAASEYIIQDLKAMNIIWSRSQILEWQTFKKASIHKTAEIIYRAFGDDYKDNMVGAAKAYKASLNIKLFNVDTNRDARLQETERKDTVGFMTR